jgi:hypothetical protein
MLTTIHRIGNLASNARVRECLRGHNLNVATVTWEDTARNKNSSWGPNITDQTLFAKGEAHEHPLELTNLRFYEGRTQCDLCRRHVPAREPTYHCGKCQFDKCIGCREKTVSHRMPVIRSPNFTDETCDVPIDAFQVKTGNETGGPLVETSLRQVLQDKGWLLPRDEKILVSTQTCVLPSACKFGVALFNYQTRAADPSLAVIAASAQGTSVAAITKSNQEVMFNDNGRAKLWEVKRLEDDRKERGVAGLPRLELTTEEKMRNVLFVFHVPLRQKKTPSREVLCYSAAAACSMNNECCDGDDGSLGVMAFQSKSRGFDAAVLAVSSEDLGEFPKLPSGLVRDDRFPVRCVIQNYAISDTDELTADDLDYIVSRLKTVYRQMTEKGSLVVGANTPNRVTEPALPPTPIVQPGFPPQWQYF